MDLLLSVVVTFFTSPLFLVMGAIAGAVALVRLVRFWRTAR